MTITTLEAAGFQSFPGGGAAAAAAAFFETYCLGAAGTVPDVGVFGLTGIAMVYKSGGIIPCLLRAGDCLNWSTTL